jgi:hypothetical protein
MEKKHLDLLLTTARAVRIIADALEDTELVTLLDEALRPFQPGSLAEFLAGEEPKLREAIEEGAA